MAGQKGRFGLGDGNAWLGSKAVLVWGKVARGETWKTFCKSKIKRCKQDEKVNLSRLAWFLKTSEWVDSRKKICKAECAPYATATHVQL